MVLRFLVIAVAAAFCLPCLAGNGTTPVIVFRNHALHTMEILYTKSSNIHPPDDCYDFVPVDGDMQASNYVNNYPEPGYTYSPPPPPVVPE